MRTELKTVEEKAHDIIYHVAKVNGIHAQSILGDCRKREFVHARHVVCFILRHYLHLTIEQIGKIMGRHHATVIHSIEAHNELLLKNRSFALNALNTHQSYMDGYSEEIKELLQSPQILK